MKIYETKSATASSRFGANDKREKFDWRSGKGVNSLVETNN